MSHKLNVMVSSTARDLPEHHKEVLDASLRQGMFPMMMEHLPASDPQALLASLKMVDEADVYVGIKVLTAGGFSSMPLFNLTDVRHCRQAYFGKTVGLRVLRVLSGRRRRVLLIGVLLLFIAPQRAHLAEHHWSQPSRPQGQAVSKEQYPPSLQESSSRRLIAALPESLNPVPPSTYSKATLADRDEGDANRPELVLQVGHNDIINSVAFSPDGRILATASQDNTVKLWNVSTGHMLRTLSGHTSQVTAAAFSPDGRWLVSASHDMLYRWEVATGRMTQMGSHNFGITVIAFNPKGRWLAAGNIYSLVRLRDITTGHETATIVGHESLPAGTKILHSMGKNRAMPLPGVPSITSVAYAPSGRMLATGSVDKTIILWDMTTARAKQLKVLRGHAGAVHSIAYSPDGRLLATASREDKTVRLWQVGTGRILRTLRSTNGQVAFSPDGQTLLARDQNGIDLWDAATGRKLRTIADEGAFALSPDGRLLAVGRKNVVRMWELPVSREARTFVGSPPEVRSVAFSHDGKQLLSLLGNDELRLWDFAVGTDKRVKDVNVGYTNGGVFNAEGHVIAWQSDEKRVRLLNLTEKRILLDLTGVAAPIAGGWAILPVAVSRGGRLLAAGSWQGFIQLWDVETRSVRRTILPRARIINVDKARVMADKEPELFKDILAFSTVWALAFSPDSRLLASVSGDNVVRVWEVTTGRELQAIEARGILDTDWVPLGRHCRSLAFSPDGRRLAAGYFSERLKVWDVATGREVASFDNRLPSRSEWNADVAYTSAVTTLAFNQGGYLASAGYYSGAINLWDVESQPPAKVRTLTGHTDGVNTVEFSPDGAYLVSGSVDGSARVWDVKSGELLATHVSIRGTDDWLIVTPDGLFDGTADAMRQVSWRAGGLMDVVTLDAFFNDFYYPGLMTEIAQGNRPKARVDIATLLQLPGLRPMMAQGMARIENRDGRTVLCFSEKPTARPQVYEDSLPFSFDPSELTFHRDDGVCPWRKELPEGRQYEIVNSSVATKEEASRPAYDGAKSETTQSTLHVLTISVGDYDLKTSGLKPLPAAVAGAKEVEKFFVEQSKANRPYSSIRIWDGLHDKAATLDAIRRRLAAMAQEVKEDDVVFLFLSGHGMVPAGQEMFYFAPIDMRGPSSQAQRETGLNTAMIAEAVRAMPARRVAVVIDACQSGGAVESLAKVGEVKVKVEAYRARLEKREGQGGHDPRVGVYIIAAATPLQEAVQPKVGNGALVATLLEALGAAGQDRDGTVWMRDVVAHVQKRLPMLSKEIGQGHTPMIVSTGLDFPMAIKKP